MSGALADEVFRRQMPDDLPAPKARDLLVVFCLHANTDGTTARPGLELVAAKVGCHENTARRHRDYWIRKGVLTLTAKPRKLAGRGPSRTSIGSICRSYGKRIYLQRPYLAL